MYLKQDMCLCIKRKVRVKGFTVQRFRGWCHLCINRSRVQGFMVKPICYSGWYAFPRWSMGTRKINNHQSRRMNVQHRTSNIEFWIMMSLRSSIWKHTERSDSITLGTLPLNPEPWTFEPWTLNKEKVWQKPVIPEKADTELKRSSGSHFSVFRWLQ